VVDVDSYVQKVSDDVYLIDPAVFDIKGYLSIYFVAGEKPLLFDVGPSSTADKVVAAVESIGYKGSQIEYLFVSHIHVDHAGAVSRMAEWAHNAKVIVAPSGMRHLVDPSKSYQAFVGLFEEFGRNIGDFPPVPQSRLMNAPVEIKLGSQTGRVISCTGHAHHQICLLLDKLFLGADVLGTQIRLGDRFLPTSAPPAFNYLKYTEDLDTILSLKIEKLCVSHYGVHEDVTGTITKAIDSVKWLRIQTDSLLKEGLSPEEAAETILKRYLVQNQDINYKLAYLHGRANILGLINSVQKIQTGR
jgi:glyoxylase-like metal-dependent hydrolase (beta-lactamase superfamily II)